MNTRRRFVTALGLAAAAPLATAEAAPARKPALKPVKIRVGHEMQGILDDKKAAYLARFGVDGVGCAAQMADPARVYATVDELKRARDLCERHKLTMDIAECALPTQNVDQQEHPAINLGQGPQRDRDIEGFQTHIRNVAAAGIPCIKYALNLLGAMRSAGPGGAMLYIPPGNWPMRPRILR